MILHPGILALCIGSALTLLMLLVAAAAGATIVVHWDYNSSSAQQLQLERRTYLVSTLVNYGLGFQLASLLLFIYTMDDVHRLFVGAMCATGSLNANPVGWYALFSKLAVFFLSGFWIALNYLDQQAEDYPLVRLKYSLLFILLPFIGLDVYLQSSYFLGLEPDIITSCCGSLFGSDGKSAISTVSELPVLPSMIAFYSATLLLIFLFGWNRGNGSPWARSLYSLITAGFFVLAIVSIISFVSIYIYELPTHHCPFDILQRGYTFIGYPLYLTLFIGTYFGMLPGLFQPLKKIHSLEAVILNIEQNWLMWSMVNLTLFVILVTYGIYRSNLTNFL